MQAPDTSDAEAIEAEKIRADAVAAGKQIYQASDPAYQIQQTLNDLAPKLVDVLRGIQTLHPEIHFSNPILVERNRKPAVRFDTNIPTAKGSQTTEILILGQGKKPRDQNWLERLYHRPIEPRPIEIEFGGQTIQVIKHHIDAWEGKLRKLVLSKAIEAMLVANPYQPEIPPDIDPAQPKHPRPKIVATKGSAATAATPKSTGPNG